jgi:type II secretory pathway component PulJ
VGNAHPTAYRTRRLRRGLGLIELLVALSISTALLVATAIAVDASFKAYEINQEESGLIQRARVALYRVTESIRTTQAHAPDTASLSSQFSTGVVVTDTGIDMFDLNNNLLVYKYDSTNQRLLAVTGGNTYTMAEGVTLFQVKMEPMKSDESVRTGGAWDLLRRVSVTISVRTNAKTTVAGDTTGQEVITLSAAVVPRRNSW